MQSDLVSGVYEGGLKVWEGTFDLLRYLMNYPEEAGQNVIELGCG